MNTPMQEMLEWVRATLPMDLDWPMLIEEKVQSLIQKEKEVMIDFAYKFGDEPLLEIAKWYDKQFNTEEK